MSTPSPHPISVIIIGAGWSGLAAAKTYLRLNPRIHLTILDDDTSPGGVWSTQRIYPGLIANSPNGLYEFSDLSMVSRERPALRPIPGAQVRDYLEGYAERFGLRGRMRFGVKVVRAVRREGGWNLTTQTGEVLECEKLIVATGLSSKPNWPEVSQEGFWGTVMHSKSLGTEYPKLQAEGVEDVIVVGGCKSAVETIGICLHAGKRVHWIVRESQQGVPMVVVDPDMRPNLVAVNNTRLFGIWSPSIFATTGFWYRLLHSGSWWIGTFLQACFWRIMSYVVLSSAGYGKSENGEKMRPKGKSMFRYGSYISLVHTNNIFLEGVHDLNKVKIYRSTPVKLSSGGMDLDTGEVIRADAVVYATGWKSTTDFFEHDEAERLGIPVPMAEQDTAMIKQWANLDAHGDSRVTKSFPRLADLPIIGSEDTHFRQYRQILSPKCLADKDRSIAFVGLIASGQTTIACELTALWAIAWMENIMPKPLPSEANMEKDVALVNAWMARRYGARGSRDPEIILEIQTFFDVLMQDLGLPYQRRRKGRFGLLREWLTPYEPRDYRDIVDEFLANANMSGKVT